MFRNDPTYGLFCYNNTALGLLCQTVAVAILWHCIVVLLILNAMAVEYWNL